MSRSRRTPGTGGISFEHGKYHVKLTDASGKRRGFGSYATREEAEMMAAAGAQELVATQMAPVGAPTWVAYAERVWLPRVEKTNPQSHRVYESRVNMIKTMASWAVLPLRAVTKRDVQEWIATQVMAADRSRITISMRLVTARLVFDAAIDDGICDDNPAREVRMPKMPKGIDGPRSKLTIDEQGQLLSCRDLLVEDRLALGFLIWTALRKWEFMALRLEDVRLNEASPRVIVRFGSANGPRKNRQAIQIPLFDVSLRCAEVWARDFLPKLPNPMGLFWPGPKGGYRHRWWANLRTLLQTAGIARRVRGHDLRHTAATSLLSGDWGRRWTLEEVQKMLGHSSIRSTEVYAKMTDDSLTRAAADTSGLRALSGRGESPEFLLPERRCCWSACTATKRRKTCCKVSDPGPSAACADLNPPRLPRHSRK